MRAHSTLKRYDDLLGAIFAVPYAVRHPDYTFVIADEQDRVVGYVVGTPDTVAFETWFRDHWWPEHVERWPIPEDSSSREAGMLRYAGSRGPDSEPHAARFPAHIHIDLLPEAQGGGWGRKLIETERARLIDAGVPGWFLTTAAANAGAISFFTRMGFTPLESSPDSQSFGELLRN